MAGIPDDRFNEANRDYQNVRDRARSFVTGPATLLILVGSMCLILVLVTMASRPQMSEVLDQMIDQVENNPNLTRDDKNEQIGMLEQIKEALDRPSAIYYSIAQLVFALLVIVGGIRMLQLSGPALPTIGAVLAMIPCTVNCCCFVGFPAGLWALVALYRPEVRAAMAGPANDSGALDDTAIE
jgi:hypothetical protein